jgi:hypothetical protein
MSTQPRNHNIPRFERCLNKECHRKIHDAQLLNRYSDSLVCFSNDPMLAQDATTQVAARLASTKTPPVGSTPLHAPGEQEISVLYVTWVAVLRDREHGVGVGAQISMV